MGVLCKTGGGKTRWVAVGLKWTDITGLELQSGEENRGPIEKCLGGHLNPANQWNLEINSVCSHSKVYVKDIIRLTAGQSCLWLGPVEGAGVSKKD